MSLVRLSRQMMRCVAIPLASLLLAGCTPRPDAKKVLPQPPPKQRAGDPFAAATAKRLRDLERETKQLSDDAKQLPGESPVEHSRIVQHVFSDLLKVLPLLANATTDRVLAQRMTIIENSRGQLANASGNLAVEPAIDTAFRAAAAALTDISHGDNYQQADVGPTLDKLSAQLNRLDTERDSDLHRVDVAETADLTSQVASNLAAAISGKLTGAPTSRPAMAPMAEPTVPSATPPATQPAAPAATPPAPEPATPAATAPATPAATAPATEPAAPATQPTTPPATQPAPDVTK